MDCPRCNTKLEPEIIKDIKSPIEVDTCSACGGSWFDKNELSQIEKVMEPTFFEFRKIPSKHEQLIPLYCPSCTNHPILEKADHPRDSHVVFDYCSTCSGIWLDKGELQAIYKENWLITIGKIFRWLVGKD